MMLKRIRNAILKKYKRLVCGKNNHIEKFVKISLNVIIGEHNVIKKGVVLGNNVIIGDNVTIMNNCILNDIEIGNGSFLDREVIVVGVGEGKIKIGKHVYIGLRNVIDHSGNVTIGDYVHIAGPSAALYTHTSKDMCLHGVDLIKPFDLKYRPVNDIIISDNCYIGCNTTVYPGIKIGKGSIIAPNTPVNKNVKPNTLNGAGSIKEIKKNR